MSKILAIRSEHAAKANSNNVYTQYNGCVWMDGKIYDYMSYSKTARQDELSDWVALTPDCRFVLINADGSGVEEL